MIIILFFLTLFFSVRQIEAQSFSYQFILANNSIDLDFLKKLELNLEEQKPKNFLSFEYKLEKQNDLPSDLPLFIVAFDKEVLFSVDSSLADSLFHQVEINLTNRNDRIPVFYQSNYLDGFKLTLENLIFIEEPILNKDKTSIIKDLSVIRELDQSLSIIFSLEETEKRQHSFQLICLDEGGEVTNSNKLFKNDDFLWSDFFFTNSFSNKKNEFIFHLDKLECSGLVYVLTDFSIQSDKTSIIRVEDL
ncbi:MAG: hypothetical protein US01_C0001G0438 [candidate division TM6 bacterium GW2011_GWF2_28_16]|nr:MAG: hypothetical protein US01_C0001G0438 [candidate division TM6 bacterium GW2011_GWF2_28_16]HAZ73281.1 hypothetical protein [Candidatus Paceibacterota bacterium]